MTEKYTFVRLSNQDRVKKMENKNQVTRFRHPRRYPYKNSLSGMMRSYTKHLGYDFDEKGSRTLKWIKQDFIENFHQHFGTKEFPKEMGRMDKIRKNQEVGRCLKRNPLVKIFETVERKIKLSLLQAGFTAIQSQI